MELFINLPETSNKKKKTPNTFSRQCVAYGLHITHSTLFLNAPQPCNDMLITVIIKIITVILITVGLHDLR